MAGEGTTTVSAAEAMAATMTDAIALSSRIRLARNLKDHRFPDWADDARRSEVLGLVRGALHRMSPASRLIETSGLPPPMKDYFVENRMISRDLADGRTGNAFFEAADPSVTVMVNEEDHLRIQCILPGFNLKQAWSNADGMDSALEAYLSWAWHPVRGYLTACPSNVGTGLRASVMVHLLGLRLMGDLEPAIQGLERLRFNVRGVGGEGSEASGQVFQISNMDSLGVTELDVIRRLERVVRALIRQECEARLCLLYDDPLTLEDALARALALLRNMRITATGEALELLSAMRLGVVLGQVAGLTMKKLDALTLAVQPGHLQRAEGGALSPDDRDVHRAELLRAAFAKVKLVNNP